MPKAILELPKMPESCRGGGCPFYKVCDICDILSSQNNHYPVYTPSEGKRADCPLKLLNDYGCEYCNAEPVSIYRSNWTIFTKGEDKLVDINFCPMCGRRLED